MSYSLSLVFVALVVCTIAGGIAGWMLQRPTSRRAATQMSRVQADLDGQRRAVDRVRTELASQSSKLESATAMLATAEASARGLRTDRDAHKARTEALEAELAKARTAYSVAASDIQALRNDLLNRDATIAQRSAALAAAIQANEAVQKQLAERDERLRAGEGTWKAREALIDSQHRELLAKRDTQFRVLQDRLAQTMPLRGQLDSLRSQHAELQGRHATAQTDHQSTLAQLEHQKNGELQRYVAQIAARDDEVAQLKVRLSQLEPLAPEVEILRGRYAEQQAVLAEINQKDATLVGELEADRSKIDDLQGRLADFERSDSYGRTVLSAKDAEIVRLRESLERAAAAGPELAALETRYRQLEADHRTARSATDGEVVRLRDALSQYGTLRGDYDVLHERFRQLEARQHAELSARDADIVKLRARVAEFEASITDA